jgi:hypothetical protein
LSFYFENDKFDKNKPMKRAILLGALLSSTLGFSQSLELTNEPAIGEMQSMFLCDSFANTLEFTTGAGVTWDYSTLPKYDGIGRDVEIVDAALHTHGASYPTSAKAIVVENTLSTFFNSSATGRISQGFVFTESSFGDIVAIFDIDEETLVDYPFSNGSSLSDTYDGDLEFTYNGVLQTPTANGNIYAQIDGQGTLLLPDGSSVSDVIRYKLHDSTFTNVVLVGDLEIIRTQYEYYDVANSNLPLLTLSRIVIQQPGGFAIADNSMVLSSVEPTTTMGIGEYDAIRYEAYPNPTNGTITLKGDFEADATGTLYDQSGRLLKTLPVTNGTSIDLSAFNTGMYLLKVTSNGATTTKTVVKK